MSIQFFQIYKVNLKKMSAQTKSIVKNSSITKVISSQFPRLNKESFLETAIEKTYVDTFLPINNYDNDNFF